jgi:hypothetical protein
MKKSMMALLICVVFIFATAAASFAAMGEMGLKSKDIDVNFFGSLKTYPHFTSNLSFNDDDQANDKLLDENGWGADHFIRNELRMGWAGKGENWNFLIILESDFNLNKANGDRGENAMGMAGSGMSGNSFGVEKLNFTYNFGSFAVETGWNTKFLDIMTGGLVYGDDHPYIGLFGKVGDNFSWEALYMIIQDNIDKNGNFGGVGDGDSLDWRAYTFKGIYTLDNGFKISPFYAFSDYEAHDHAQSHYFGLEGYGKIGMLTPRFEAVYVTGDTNDMDISAWAAYASCDFNIKKELVPYIGVTFRTGDDDANDDDIEAYNSITNIARYTPTFGIENAFVYRYNAILGSHLYANDFDMLGGAGNGYGGISGSASGNSPGMISFGIGAKGTIDKWSYKAQIMYFQFEDEGALEDVQGTSIDDEVGIEYDFRFTYKFSNHFSLGNTIAVFDPGDAIEDLYGDDYDDIGVMDTIEMVWKW